MLCDIACMRTGIGVASVGALLTLLTACASSAGVQPQPSPRDSESPATSTSVTAGPNAFEVESPRTIRECGVRREFDTTGVPNPCEQAKHLHSLFSRNKDWDALHGFTIHVGGIGKCGIRLTVYGDVEEAREAFNGDPLVAVITTNDEGLPPDC